MSCSSLNFLCTVKKKRNKKTVNEYQLWLPNKICKIKVKYLCSKQVGKHFISLNFHEELCRKMPLLHILFPKLLQSCQVTMQRVLQISTIIWQTSTLLLPFNNFTEPLIPPFKKQQLHYQARQGNAMEHRCPANAVSDTHLHQGLIPTVTYPPHSLWQ